MTDATFRTKAEPAQKVVKEIVVDKSPITTASSKIEVPFKDYLAEHGKPFLADYYSLGDYWQIWNKEIDSITNYFNKQIETGKIANSLNAVKDMIRKAEKLNNLTGEERVPVKIGTISSYIRFLNDSDMVRENSVKYGNQ